MGEMDKEPEVVVSDDLILPQRKRKTSLWQDIPIGVKIAAALCLVFLATFLIINRNRVPDEPVVVVKPRVSAGEAFDRVMARIPKVDLVLSRSEMNPATRRIEGVLTNTSDRRYSNIEITFFTSANGLRDGVDTVVRVAQLEPHSEASFSTDPIDPRLREWAVKSIQGTPR